MTKSNTDNVVKYLNKVASTSKDFTKDYCLYVDAIIYTEINHSVQSVTSSDAIEYLGYSLLGIILSVCGRLYDKIDYSSPTGVGVIVGDYLREKIEEGEDDEGLDYVKGLSFDDLAEELREAYFDSDWR